MKVIIKESAIDHALESGNETHLTTLLHYAATGRHHIMPENDSCRDKIISVMAERFHEKFIVAIDHSMRDLLRQPAGKSTLIISCVEENKWNSSSYELDLVNALELLDERLSLLVENSANDWNFLKGMLRKRDREILTAYEENGWLDVINGGGSDLIRIFQERKTVKKKLYRTFVMFDSDRLHPVESQPGWDGKCPRGNSANCPAFSWEQEISALIPESYWRLNRRYIESYMPRAEFERIQSPNFTRLTTEAFFRMSAEQRDHFNMKKGFTGDAAHQGIGRIRDLYSNIPDDDKVELQNGFGRNLAKHYENASAVEFSWDDNARSEADTATTKLMRLI